MSGSFDPFTIEIVKEKLHAAADEMGVVLARTSMSPIVYEVLDFACGITDADAQVVAQTNGLTLFTGTFGPQIQSILRKHGLEGMRDGDVFATNIPYEGGTHTCDVCLVKPILVQGRVIAFAVSVTHWIEIGGAVPGSISPEATEIYQEGLQLPGVRIVEQGVVSRTLIDLIEANIRLPRTGIGDLNAGLAATAIGEARVREACERYGAELVQATFARVLDHGEQIARAELRTIPNGVYRADGRDRRRRRERRRDPDHRRGHGRRRLPARRLHGLRAPDPRAGELHHRRPALGLQDGRARDHRSRSALERRLLPSLQPDRAARHDLQRRGARADRLVLRGRGVRQRPDLEGARPRRPREARRRQLREPLLLVHRRHRRGRRAVRAGRAERRRLGRQRARRRRLGADRDDRRRHLQLPRRGRREPLSGTRAALRPERRGGRRRGAPPRRLRGRARVPRARRRRGLGLRQHRRLRARPVGARRRLARHRELPRVHDVASSTCAGDACPACRSPTAPSSARSPEPAAASAIRASASPSACGRTCSTAT